MKALLLGSNKGEQLRQKESNKLKKIAEWTGERKRLVLRISCKNVTKQSNSLGICIWMENL